MWKLIENPQENEPIVFLGVHALRWRPEWGEPAVAFVDVDGDELDCLIAENKRLREELEDFHKSQEEK